MHVVHTETKGLFSRIFYSSEAEVPFYAYKYNTSTVAQDEADPLYSTIQYKYFYNSSVQYKTVQESTGKSEGVPVNRWFYSPNNHQSDSKS